VRPCDDEAHLSVEVGRGRRPRDLPTVGDQEAPLLRQPGRVVGDGVERRQQLLQRQREPSPLQQQLGERVTEQGRGLGIRHRPGDGIEAKHEAVQAPLLELDLSRRIGVGSGRPVAWRRCRAIRIAPRWEGEPLPGDWHAPTSSGQSRLFPGSSA
jgi:hypothetical protein